MKKLIILALVLILVAVGALGYAVSRAGDIVAEYKPELERLASESLGSTVTLGNLSVAIFPSARVVIDSAKVANPDNDDENVTVDQVSLNLELIPLLSGKVSITTLDVIAPNIKVIRADEGIFIEGLPRTSADAAPVAATTESTPTAVKSDMPLTIDLKSFNIKNATLTWKNNIGEADYIVEDFAMNASFSFAGEEAVFTSIKGNGTFMETIDFKYGGDELRYGLDDGTIGLKGLNASALGSGILVNGELSQGDSAKAITIASDGIVLDEMKPFFTIFAPAAIDFGLKGTVKPNLNFAFTPSGYKSTGTLAVTGLGAEVEELVGFDDLAGTFDVVATEAQQSLTSQKLSGSLNNAPFGLKMTAAMNPKTGTLDPFALGAFGGQTITTTKLTLDDPAYPFTATINASSLYIEQLIPAFAPDMPFAITGSFHELSGNVSGTLDENMMASLKGQSKVLFNDGLITDINLGQTVLESVTGLPFLAGALSDVVPPEMQAFLTNKDTILSEVSGSFTLENELMTSNNMKVVSDFFSLDAKGTIGLDTNLNLDSIIHFSPTFSAELVDEVKELRALLDNQGRISFPVKVTGIPPEIETKPDLAGVLKDALKNTVKNEIGD